MSFSKCSNLGAKKLNTSDLEIKDRTMIAKKQNFQNEAFKIVLRT